MFSMISMDVHILKLCKFTNNKRTTDNIMKCIIYNNLKLK